MDMGRNASYVLGGAPVEVTEASGGRHFTNWHEMLFFLTAALRSASTSWLHAIPSC